MINILLGIVILMNDKALNYEDEQEFRSGIQGNGLDYEFGTVNNSYKFDEYIEDLNLKEILKNKVTYGKMYEAVIKCEHSYPTIHRKEWKQIAVICVYELLVNHRKMEFEYKPEDVESEDYRANQFNDYLGTYLYSRMLNYIDTYKGLNFSQGALNKYSDEVESEMGLEENTLRCLENESKIEQLKEELTPREEEVLDSHFIGELSVKETARKFGLKDSTIRGYKKKILDKFKEN